MADTFGRVARSARVSVTDRCNLRCRYCMPAHGLRWIPRDDLLTAGEMVRLVGVMAGRGITDVRVTGGEPLMRPDLDAIVAGIARTPGVREVSMTTNGVLLSERLDDLVAAGLVRVNVSVDSLDPDRFEAITRRRDLDRVLAGLEACTRHPGLGPIKVNAVLQRGLGDEDVIPLAELARTGPFIVRFIESMPLDADGAWTPEAVIPGDEVRAAINARWPLVPAGRDRPAAPATSWRFADGRGEVQFVSSVTEPFCAQCDRIRLTADGQLRTCLFAIAETDLRGAMRTGATDEELGEALGGAVWEKPAGHGIGTPGWSYEGRPMSRIGG